MHERKATLARPENRDRLVRYLLGKCGDAALAEDLAQDVLERVLRAIELTDVRDPMALAFRVADNSLIDHHRWSRRRPRDPLSPLIAAVEASPERIAVARDDVGRVTRVLDAMPAQRRDILVRRRVHGESCAAIAASLGVSVKAVEKQITKALAELADALGRPRGEA